MQDLYSMFTLPPKTTGDQHIKATFQALADAIVPATPWLSLMQGSEHAGDGMDLNLDEFITWCLDYYLAVQGVINVINIPLSGPTAGLLDAAADRLIATGGIKDLRHSEFSGGGAFASLSRDDRCRAIALLEHNNIELRVLPPPYQNNAGLVKFIADALNRFVVFGYYSEWSGYGTTRLALPDNRVLERLPAGWQEVQYPGPSNGYRKLRRYKLSEFKK